MKMRGYSVLFVSAFCVFVLCGAAAVVAQDVTPKKKPKTLKIIADTAEEWGNEALSIQEEFTSNVSSVVSNLSLVVEKLSFLKTTAEQIKDDIPKKQQILEEIEKIETMTEDAEAAVEAIKSNTLLYFKDEHARAEFKDNVRYVERNITEVERAVAAVTDNISAIDVFIVKVSALGTAVIKGRVLSDIAMGDLEIQSEKTMEAIAAVGTAITAVGNAINSFGDDSDTEAQEVKEELMNAVKTVLTQSLEKLMFVQNASQKAMKAAGEAEEQYSELKDEAMELTYAAEDCKQMPQEWEQKVNEWKQKVNEWKQRTEYWRQSVQKALYESVQVTKKPNLPHEAADTVQSAAPEANTTNFTSSTDNLTVTLEKTGDRSAGPLCSLALPAFFFCCCVLFGM